MNCLWGSVTDVEYNLSFGGVNAQSTELCGNLKLNISRSSVSRSFRHGRFVIKAFHKTRSQGMQLLVSGVWCQLGEIQGCPTDCGQSAPELESVCIADRNLCMLPAARDSACRGNLGTFKGYQGPFWKTPAEPRVFGAASGRVCLGYRPSAIHSKLKAPYRETSYQSLSTNGAYT